MPMTFDGLPYLPSGIHMLPDGTIVTGSDAVTRSLTDPDGYLLNVIGLLGTTSAATHARHRDPVDGVAAILGRIRRDAVELTGHAPAQTVIVTPAIFGPRRNSLMRLAADRANLPDPILVPAPIAAARHVAQHATTPLPIGSLLLVGDLGASAYRAHVVHRVGEREWDLLATIVGDSAGGDSIDHDLIARAATDAGIAAETIDLASLTRPPARRLIQNAKHAACLGDATVIRLSSSDTAVTVDRDAVAAAAATVRPRIAHTTRSAIDAADVPADALTLAVLIGGGAHLPGVDMAIREAVGETVAVTVATHPRDTAVLGARHSLAATGGLPSATWAAASPSGSFSGQLTSVIITAIASLALFVHTGVSAYVDRGDLYVNFVIFNTGEFAIATTLAALAGLLAARTFATTLLAGATPHQARRGWISAPARGFLAAAAVATAVGIIYSLLTAVSLELTAGEFLSTALATTLPAAVISCWIAALTPRIAYLGGSAFNRLRHPAVAVILAAAGIALTQYSVSVPLPAWQVSTLGRFGGALLGAGCAWTLTRRALSRIVATALLGMIGALAYESGESQTIGYAYVVCLFAWMIGQVAAMTTDAYPQLWPTARRAPAALENTCRSH